MQLQLDGAVKAADSMVKEYDIPLPCIYVCVCVVQSMICQVCTCGVLNCMPMSEHNRKPVSAYIIHVPTYGSVKYAQCTYLCKMYIHKGITITNELCIRVSEFCPFMLLHQRNRDDWRKRQGENGRNKSDWCVRSGLA